MPKQNTLADKAVGIAMQQLQTSYNFKRPRVRRIADFRRLYNTQLLPKLRIQFNVPLPVFAGMIDTLQADLDDKLVIEYQNTDPADWKAINKANAAIRKMSESANPNAQWEKKFRQYRFEKIMSGRGIIKYGASSDNGFTSNLEVVPFEDFFFEPRGGGNLENHLFAGQQNIWKTKGEIEKLADAGIYDKGQVKLLLESGGNDYKMASIWDGSQDIANRFEPLGLSPSTNNYVGEESFNLCEWVMEYQGRRWYLVFEPYTGIWLRFEKNEDICSADYLPWISSASHEDIKNFASKSFADDLYPVADSIITLFNQDLTNRQKRNLNARGFDNSMFPDLAKLDEAQYRPDALVPINTHGGTRRISEAVYEFKTPEVGGTVNLIQWLEQDTGKNLGVTEMQQGASQAATKKVGVAYAELAQVSKRLAFNSAPFTEMGQQLGSRVFVGLKDYMKEPIAIQLLGETGIEWDVLKRIDLNLKKPFEITVTSATSKNNTADVERERKLKAFNLIAGSPNINAKARDEFILSEIGGFSEYDTAAIMDVADDSDKETRAEVSSAIQEIVLRSKKPKTNWNADRYFVKRLLDFAKKHRDTLPEKKYKLLMECADEHMPIAAQNVKDEVQRDAAMQIKTGQATPTMPGNPSPQPNNIAPKPEMPGAMKEPVTTQQYVS